MMTRHAQSKVKLIEVLETVPATGFAGWRPDHSPRTGQNSAVGSRSVSEKESNRGTGLDETALRLLRAVVAEPGLPSSQYARLARLNAQRAVEVRRLLVERGFLREHAVATSSSGRGRGRSAIVLEPLPTALELINGARGAS